MSSVKENLKKAMKIVKNHWVKGTFDNGNGRYCALGAIRKATGGSWYSVNEENAPSEALPVGWNGVMSFNDSVNTHHSDIMKLFRKAIRDC